MSADSPHEIIRCEPSSRDGFAAKPENNNRRIRGASSRSSLKRKEIQMRSHPIGPHNAQGDVGTGPDGFQTQRGPERRGDTFGLAHEESAPSGGAQPLGSYRRDGFVDCFRADGDSYFLQGCRGPLKPLRSRKQHAILCVDGPGICCSLAMSSIEHYDVAGSLTWTFMLLCVYAVANLLQISHTLVDMQLPTLI
ncbi:hypothetical protein KCU72_g56, partial [Aureobasidium melanogenum]